MSFNIWCLGANQESKYVLEKLLENGVPISGLITLPENSINRGSDYEDLHSLADLYELEVIDTEDINDGATRHAIATWSPDYLFVLGWSQIIKPETLKLFSCFVVGSHPSKLPAGRGRAPIPWTILEQKKSSAVTLFRMTPGVDDGKILIQKHFNVPERAHASDLYEIVQRSLFEAFIELNARITSDSLEEVAQDHSKRSYRGKRTPDDGFIDFTASAVNVDCLVRAVSEPYPGAYFYANDEKITVWEAEVYYDVERLGVPGQVLSKSGNWLIVRCFDGCVKLGNFKIGLEDVSIERFKVGDVLNYRTNDEIHYLRSKVKHLEEMIALLTNGLSK